MKASLREAISCRTHLCLGVRLREVSEAKERSAFFHETLFPAWREQYLHHVNTHRMLSYGAHLEVNDARKKKALNKKYNRWYDKHKSGVACKRRSHRQRDLQAFNARRNERETNRRKAFLSDLLRRLESIRDGNEDIATLHETLSSRKDALCAVRERLRVPTLDIEPCEHSGAHLFAQKSRGMCCKHGTYICCFRTITILFPFSS